MDEFTVVPQPPLTLLFAPADASLFVTYFSIETQPKVSLSTLKAHLTTALPSPSEGGRSSFEGGEEEGKEVCRSRSRALSVGNVLMMRLEGCESVQDVVTELNSLPLDVMRDAIAPAEASTDPNPAARAPSVASPEVLAEILDAVQGSWEWDGSCGVKGEAGVAKWVDGSWLAEPAVSEQVVDAVRESSYAAMQ